MANPQVKNGYTDGEGWVCLHRQSLSNGWLRNHKLWVFWCYCLLKASHRERKIIIGNQQVTLQPGQFVFGRKKASKEIGLSEQSIRTCVYNLCTLGNLTIKTTSKYSLVTIVNWELYQVNDRKIDYIIDEFCPETVENCQWSKNNEKSTSKSTSKTTNEFCPEPVENQESYQGNDGKLTSKSTSKLTKYQPAVNHIQQCNKRKRNNKRKRKCDSHESLFEERKDSFLTGQEGKVGVYDTQQEGPPRKEKESSSLMGQDSKVQAMGIQRESLPEKKEKESSLSQGKGDHRVRSLFDYFIALCKEQEQFVGSPVVEYVKDCSSIKRVLISRSEDQVKYILHWFINTPAVRKKGFSIAVALSNHSIATYEKMARWHYEG